MDKRRRKQAKTSSCCSEEVSSIEWEFINMSEQEEDLIYRMYKLVGDSSSWSIIHGPLLDLDNELIWKVQWLFPCLFSVLLHEPLN
ncbi:PREDICTED: transcription factor CPC isoform X1 [Theobroma cacao]|uniref:Transcription factor CPC isoform X1 n=1 Tax=Theobroma cacao TaxID=3641 RepID=A0AB32VZM4_THECC|nr:PREDICTED: transcription factor CPC isoform X1 [Theobroma cacao]